MKEDLQPVQQPQPTRAGVPDPNMDKDNPLKEGNNAKGNKTPRNRTERKTLPPPCHVSFGEYGRTGEEILGAGVGSGVDLSMETVDWAKSSVEDRIKKNLQYVTEESLQKRLEFVEDLPLGLNPAEHPNGGMKLDMVARLVRAELKKRRSPGYQPQDAQQDEEEEERRIFESLRFTSKDVLQLRKDFIISVFDGSSGLKRLRQHINMLLEPS